MKLNLVATCLFGLEHLLGEEIEALGYDRIETIDGRVTFAGDEQAVALSNVFLRYAERVYILLGSFPAPTFDALFEGTRALPWEAFIGRDDAFPVKGHAINSALHSVPDCQKIIKKAIATRLTASYGLLRFPETGVSYSVEFFLLRDRASLMIDTSGAPLHKRGWRTEAGVAPIRETLAAAMAAISRPREDVLFADPFCGSGTIAIEAAMLHNRIAPGRFRRFAAEAFPAIPASLFACAREEAADNERKDGFAVLASDIDPAMVERTLANARRAHVDATVHACVADARNFVPPAGRKGSIVTNPPYGERLMAPGEVEQLYRDFGAVCRGLGSWHMYVITSHPDLPRLFGRRADKIRKLYNGMIPCFLYQFFRTDAERRAREAYRKEVGKK